MSNIKRKIGILVLIIFIAVISIYALLPHILISVITTSLEDAGLQVDKLTVGQVATDHIEIPHARLKTANGTTIELERLSVSFSTSQIISGRAESLSAQRVGIHLTDEKSDPIETLSKLHHLLESDLSDLVPLTSATINSLILHDAQGKSLLQAVATLESGEKSLEMDVEMQSQNGETRHVHINQQQPGYWNLQAVDPDGSKLVDASFQQAQEFPLNVELNASLKQLKPWSLMFGFPLPEYLATTQAAAPIQISTQLKPDYKKKTLQFILDAKSQDINEAEITLQSATVAMSGEAAMREGQKIEVTTQTDFSLTGLKRDNLSTNSLDIGFDARLFVSKEGIQGSFMPGLNIETHNLKLFDSQIENAFLESVSEQAFNWNTHSGNWQFENNTLRVKKVDVLIGDTSKLTEGVFDLTHTAWSYPLKGMTSFELSGTAQGLQQNALQLTDNTVQLSGDINWKTAQNPASVSTDIQLAAKHISRNTLSGDDALLTGKTQLVFNQDTIQTSLDEASRLTINKAILGNREKPGSTQIESLQISPLDQLNLQWNRVDESLDIKSNRLEFSHKGLVLEKTTISPGELILSFDNWNNKQPKLSGTLSGDSIKMVTTKQNTGPKSIELKTIELKNTDATYTVNWPTLTLKGKSELQLSDSRIHFNLSHNAESGRGSASYKSDSQEITSATQALKGFLPNWPHKLQLLKGSTSFSGKAKWHKKDISATATLQLNNVNGQYANTNFSGLDSSIDLDLLPTFKGKSRSIRVELIDTGGSSQPSSALDFDDWDDIITPEVAALVLGDSIDTAAPGQALQFKNTEATLRIKWPTLSLSGKSTLQLSNSRIHFDLSHNVASGRGSTTYRSDNQGITSATQALKRMTPDWPPELHLLSGTTSFSGKANWQDTDISAAATLKLNNIGGNYGETYFSGLDSNIDLDLLPTFKGKSRSVRIALIDIGIPISQFSTTLQITKASPQKKPVVTLRNTKAKLLSGNVTGNQIKLDLNQRSNDFTLAFKGVDIAELVKLHQFEGLNAIGKISGTIPIRMGPEGISVSNGKASADNPGGSISYIPEDGGKALRSAAAETGVVLDVLRDFQYNKMDVTGKYQPDGQLQMKLEIKGKNPQYDKNRPVHLNLNLDQNILSLLKSVRAINGLNGRLDKAVQKYYQSRQR